MRGQDYNEPCAELPRPVSSVPQSLRAWSCRDSAFVARRQLGEAVRQQAEPRPTRAAVLAATCQALDDWGFEARAAGPRSRRLTVPSVPSPRTTPWRRTSAWRAPSLEVCVSPIRQRTAVLGLRSP